MFDYNELMQMAKDASKNAYCKYSNFKVGACVLTDSGKTFKGCNFENSSYGLAICAERCAVGAAIVNGETKINAIAIYSPNTDNCYPCGACRQVLLETEMRYKRPIRVLMYGTAFVYEILGTKDLLPLSFTDKSMD